MNAITRRNFLKLTGLTAAAAALPCAAKPARALCAPAGIKNSRPRAAMPPRTGVSMLPWYHLVLLPPHGIQPSKLRRRDPAVTAGRFTGRTRHKLRALVLRPCGSETIFGFLYPARLHLTGLSAETNAKAYSSHHCFFRCCAIQYTKKPDLSSGNRKNFLRRISLCGRRGSFSCAVRGSKSACGCAGFRA